ncbi:MAG: glycosyltransferase family 61 protein [Algoriphagus aquaeductus]|uniref:glycosyltransferase family 61 protein n=2 Tax=Algoriphagus TaxID=246875 RepID=UPI0038791AA8
MIEEITVNRNPPANLKPEDYPLFRQSLQTTFRRLHPITIKNAWILQDTVFSPGEFRFYSEFTHQKKLPLLPIAKRIGLCAVKSWKKIPKGIWILDEWSPNYFHWMADCLPRLWEGLDRAPEFPVILPEFFKNIPFVVQSLSLIKVRVEYFKTSENVKVDTLVLTARTASYPNFNLPLTKRTRENLALHSTKSPWRKIYISRKFAPKRRAHNEDEVEVLLVKKGFEIVYAEKLTVHQQIRLMSETSVLAGLHGAALTNMFFLPKTAKVLELRNQNDHLTQCFFKLASALDLAYYYTLNRGDSENTILTDFTIDLEALDKTLDQILF